jgi:hypothetical protein
MAASSPAEARHLPTFRANEERLEVLAGICAELNRTFAGAAVEQVAGERPPTWHIRLASGRMFASFGVIDATYFWTFDGGESMHYATNKDVMRRLLAFELTGALQKEPVP